MPRMVIVDPALRNKSGHHYNFDLSLIEEARRHKMPTTLLAHLHPEDRDLLTVLRTTSAFRLDQYCVPYMGEELLDGGLPAAAQVMNNEYFNRFQEFLPNILNTGDLLIFHSMTSGIVESVGRWIAAPNFANKAHVVVMFMSGDYLDYPEGTQNELTPFYRRFFEHLDGIDPGAYTLFAENQEIVDDLLKLTDGNLTIGVTPHCKPSSTLKKLRDALPDCTARPDILNIGYFGQSAYPRGSHLIYDAVRKINERATLPIRFSIQMNLRYYEYWAEKAPNMKADVEALRNIDNVTLTEGQVDIEEYYNNVAGTDIMLLPYGEHYLRQGSGVFFESLALGKLMVIPANSFMSNFIRDIDGVATEIKSFDSESLAVAALQAIDDFEKMDPTARRTGFKWQDDFDLSKHFDALLEKL